MGQPSPKTKYKKTLKFSEVMWNTTFDELRQDPESTGIQSREERCIFLQETLQKRLEQCERDFLVCIHEVETYKSLCLEYPDLVDSLFDVQRQTKTQSSKLMGKIRAIKMALALS